MKTIEFNDILYKIQFFKYRNGRNGFTLKNINNNEWFSGTINLEKTPINENEVIVKSHDINAGLLECLVENGVIHKQAKAIVLGFNDVYICKIL